jgi:hypothetical protein
MISHSNRGGTPATEKLIRKMKMADYFSEQTDQQFSPLFKKASFIRKILQVANRKKIAKFLLYEDTAIPITEGRSWHCCYLRYKWYR